MLNEVYSIVKFKFYSNIVHVPKKPN